MPSRKPSPDELAAFRTAIAGNNVIQAILVFRQVTGADLLSAKQFVDFCSGRGALPPNPAKAFAGADPSEWTGSAGPIAASHQAGKPSKEDLDRFHEAIRNRKVIDAIKVVREVTGCGLADGKQFVEAYREQTSRGAGAAGPVGDLHISDWLPRGEGEPPMPSA